MHPPSLTDYGILGLFVMLLFKDVIRPLISKKTDNGTAGERSPEYWKAVFRETTRESIDDKLSPIMNRQTQLLEKFEGTMERMATNLERLIDRRNRA